MEIERKHITFQDIGDDARRQYIDARATFEALEAAEAKAATVRGGMYWKSAKGADYLVRTSAGNAQKSLGPRSAETEAIHLVSRPARPKSRREQKTFAKRSPATSA